jgi:hypothetical protein
MNPVMEDRTIRHRLPTTNLLASSRRALILTAALAACALSGCSLFVMAGKMIFDNPKVPSAFKTMTHVDLAKSGKTLLVVCSMPEAIKAEFPSVGYDLVDGVARRLKTRGIKVVNPDEVATWMDENGGRFTTANDLTDQFDADYIVHIDINQFDYHEENSPTLFRGTAIGNVFVYQVEVIGGSKQTREAFVREFTSVYPGTHPVSVDQMSSKVFTKRYLERVSGQLAQMFYDHTVSEEIH